MRPTPRIAIFTYGLSHPCPNHCEFLSFHCLPVCLYFVYAILTCPDARSLSVSFCVDNVCSAHCAPLYNLIQVFTHSTLVHTHPHSQIRTLSPMLQQIPCVLYRQEFIEVLVCAKTFIHAHTIQCATCICVLGTDALSIGVGGWVLGGRSVGPAGWLRRKHWSNTLPVLCDSISASDVLVPEHTHANKRAAELAVLRKTVENYPHVHDKYSSTRHGRDMFTARVWRSAG